MWHPSRKILAVGWETGEITIRNEHESETYEAPLFHKSEITAVQWTSMGTKLLTADAVCMVVPHHSQGYASELSPLISQQNKKFHTSDSDLGTAQN